MSPKFFARLNYYIEHTEQLFDGVDEIYNQKLGEVLNFFASKLELYYSSSRLTLLLTLLNIPPDRLPPITGFGANIIPLPSRLWTTDINAFGLWRFFSISYLAELDSAWNIFRDFLGSGHPLALNGQRHAFAASACLKIIFKHYQVPLSRFPRSSRHSLTQRLTVDMQHLPHRHDVNLPGWKNFLGTYFSCARDTYQGIPGIYAALDRYQHFRSSHLQFLENSAYSDSLVKFAHRRVFRFRYLHRNHPTHMKKAIFALAKYIHRVTGEREEVKACESIWGCDKWITAR